ncbi:MAG: nuclear transport factor 2 family protein [Acidimicrobiia bacterium]
MSREVIDAMFDRGVFMAPEEEMLYRVEDGFIAEIPQSGERIEGREAMVELQRTFPEPPSVELRRVSGEGDHWAVETVQSYVGDGDYHVCVLIEFRDGKIARETRYYGKPFTADR